jgi:hypothetical protein
MYDICGDFECVFPSFHLLGKVWIQMEVTLILKFCVSEQFLKLVLKCCLNRFLFVFLKDGKALWTIITFCLRCAIPLSKKYQKGFKKLIDVHMAIVLYSSSLTIFMNSERLDAIVSKCAVHLTVVLMLIFVLNQSTRHTSTISRVHISVEESFVFSLNFSFWRRYLMVLFCFAILLLWF